MTNNGHRKLLQAGQGIDDDPFTCPFCGSTGMLIETKAGGVFGEGLEGISDGDPVVVGWHEGRGFHHTWWIKGYLNEDE